jgi:hypothetical protein
MQFWKKNFFLGFGKKITRVPVVKHRNDIKIRIALHPAIKIPRQVYGVKKDYNPLKKNILDPFVSLKSN